MTLSLTDQIVGLHEHFSRANISHAFGGALALAFCTAEPRGTKDIDVNVFVDVGGVDDVIAALPAAVSATDAAVGQLRADGQARLFWDTTPIDIFLSTHPFHDHAESSHRTVPFAGLMHLPVLACADLAVFKSFFARPKDGVDLTAMVTAGAIDLIAVERTVATLLGDTASRQGFFDRIRLDLSRASS
ncbi:MAG: hypothetical protein GXP35_16385 [Actinobacteria bacterium]|nr:hypothetical protein [Actinomycetota bacterium]